ncbi:MAG: hypothetical protein H6Q71_2934 [Firmicutes bacterium]|nr:hypothetical protein [Bacillota bacterium]
MGKVFVQITAVHDTNGIIKPTILHWADGRKWDIDKVRLGIWGDLRELSALKVINSTKRFRKTKLLGYRYSIRD